MIESSTRGNAHLRAFVQSRGVIRRARRESRTTPLRRTVVPGLRWSVALTAIALLVVGCGGGRRNDTYARGTQVQEQCCEHLQGRDRELCLSEVIRVGDPGAATTATNQQTFACVVEHFVCDPQTGRETTASAQAQHDCTEDIK
ncbi:MAG: hypothetical protein JWP01_2947 [Myxococcales bacterium]|nr:hypothetical protein [Myxococcales bacterium]